MNLRAGLARLLDFLAPASPKSLTRGDVVSKLETLEFLMKNSRECLRADEASRFDTNIRFAIEQLEEIERRFDARGGSGP